MNESIDESMEQFNKTTFQIEEKNYINKKHCAVYAWLENSAAFILSTNAQSVISIYMCDFQICKYIRAKFGFSVSVHFF